MRQRREFFKDIDAPISCLGSEDVQPLKVLHVGDMLDAGITDAGPVKEEDTKIPAPQIQQDSFPLWGEHYSGRHAGLESG